jgi:hypothetical protein
MSTLYKAPTRFLQVYFSKYHVSHVLFLDRMYVNFKQEVLERAYGDSYQEQEMKYYTI